MGGSDQWGNITTGTELISRKAGGKAYALTTPLITKSDGTKFGKSESGNVWLDPQRTSPYKFYQFWLNVSDADLPKLLRVFTLFDKSKIESLEQEYLNSNPNALKRILAEDMTTRVHSQEETDKAIAASRLLFGKSTLEDFEAMDEQVLQEVFEGVPTKEFSRMAFEELNSTIDLLHQTMESKNFSKGEIKKMIQNNGISINQQKVSKDQGQTKPSFNFFSLLKGKYLLVKKGKDYFLAVVS